jgi:circadian clock protein KaiC
MGSQWQNNGKVVSLRKAPTGIEGFDEITGGGLPHGRPSLICGSAGCGKTLFSIEFLVRGIAQFNEPGVFIAFEETSDELAKNVTSLGFDLNRLIKNRKLAIDHIHVDPNDVEEAGDYDLEGLFIRIGHAIDSVGAKRVVLDTIESLFGGFSNQLLLRAELRRLFRWLKDKGVTAAITAERGDGNLTRHGLEEYVADCVVLLDHRVQEQISTRRLRIVKYRGSHHGTNEYPFLIDQKGISVLPITSLELKHQASKERTSTGLAKLDEMLGGKGLYRGSSVLVTGSAGSGKSSLAAVFAASSCRNGERTVYFAFEESESQILRNMRSIGIDLAPHVRKGLLRVYTARPTSNSLEMHLALVHQVISEFEPRAAVFDPITNLISVGSELEVRSMLTRLIDFLKTEQVTALFTSLTAGDAVDQTEVGVSSLMDTWWLLRNLESNGERNRALYILKSRGMAHSNQVREFLLSDRGIDLVDVYLGDGTVLAGSARVARESRDRMERLEKKQADAKRRREAERKRKAIQAQIAVLEAELATQRDEVSHSGSDSDAMTAAVERGTREMASSRGGNGEDE